MLNAEPISFSYSTDEENETTQIECIMVTLSAKLRRHTPAQQSFIASVVLSSAIQELWREFKGDAPVAFADIWPFIEQLASKVPSSDKMLISFPSFVGFGAIRDERWPIVPALRVVFPRYLALSGGLDSDILLRGFREEFDLAVGRAQAQLHKDVESHSKEGDGSDSVGDTDDDDDDDSISARVAFYGATNVYMPNWVQVMASGTGGHANANQLDENPGSISAVKWTVGANKFPVMGASVDRVLDPFANLETHEFLRLSNAYNHPKRDCARAAVAHQIIVSGGRRQASLQEDQVGIVQVLEDGRHRLDRDFVRQCASLAIESQELCVLRTFDPDAPDVMGSWESTLAVLVRAMWGQGDDYRVCEETMITDIVEIVEAVVQEETSRFKWGDFRVKSPIVAAESMWQVDLSESDAFVESHAVNSQGRLVRKSRGKVMYDEAGASDPDSGAEGDSEAPARKKSKVTVKKLGKKAASSKRGKANQRRKSI